MNNIQTKIYTINGINNERNRIEMNARYTIATLKPQMPENAGIKSMRLHIKITI